MMVPQSSVEVSPPPHCLSPSPPLSPLPQQRVSPGSFFTAALAAGFALLAVALTAAAMAISWAQQTVDADDDYGLIGDCVLALFASACCQGVCGAPSDISDYL